MFLKLQNPLLLHLLFNYILCCILLNAFLQGKRLIGVVGASGGSMIIAGTTEVFLNHFAKKMDPLSSVMAPRVYHQVLPRSLFHTSTILSRESKQHCNNI